MLGALCTHTHHSCMAQPLAFVMISPHCRQTEAMVLLGTRQMDENKYHYLFRHRHSYLCLIAVTYSCACHDSTYYTLTPHFIFIDF